MVDRSRTIEFAGGAMIAARSYQADAFATMLIPDRSMMMRSCATASRP